MSLRFMILAETVLKGLARDYPVFGNPEIREEVAREIHSAWSASSSENENRVALRAAAIAAAVARAGDEANAPVEADEFYAVNVMSMRFGAVAEVKTHYVSIPGTVSLEAVERFFGKGEGASAVEGVLVLSINVEFEALPPEVEMTFLEKAGETVAVRGLISVGGLRSQTRAEIRF